MENLSAHPDRRAVVGTAIAVFALAVMLRLPSCYESFWLDELHTAWAIWGSLGDVAPRAEVGNQTPLYFQLMWVWKQLVGKTEVALRLTSVLATSAASALIVIAVTQSTKKVLAGLLSGLILAVESNSLFFGTEFRPYASLMLLSVVATWTAVALLQDTSSIRPANLRLILLTVACLAIVLHPTALVTFGILVLVTLTVSLATWLRSPNKRFHLHRSDLASIVVVVATFIAMANSSLSESWERRDQWRAFGRATEVRQLWSIWPWMATVLVPLGLGAAFIGKRTAKENLAAVVPMAVALMATAVFFVASYNDWVPLWHRRYFVAVLPMLAWTAGVWSMMGFSRATSSAPRVVAFVLVIVVTSLLMWQQGTSQRLMAGKKQLVIRGEDWRGAIQWVNDHRAGGLVFLDSGLIEVNRLSKRSFNEPGSTRMEQRYFTFPVRGPYAISASIASAKMHPERGAYGALSTPEIPITEVVFGLSAGHNEPRLSVGATRSSWLSSIVLNIAASGGFGSRGFKLRLSANGTRDDPGDERK